MRGGQGRGAIPISHMKEFWLHTECVLGERQWAHPWDPHSNTSITPEVPLVQNHRQGTSLVAQWLRIYLPMQGTRVRSLVGEEPT